METNRDLSLFFFLCTWIDRECHEYLIASPGHRVIVIFKKLLGLRIQYFHYITLPDDLLHPVAI